MNEKLPPFNVDAEEGVLGSLLLDVAATCDLIPEDFYREKNRWVYEACLQNGRDQITVARQLASVGKLELVGGVGFLSELIAKVPTPLHLTFYAAEVKRCSVARQLIVASGEIAAMGYSSGFEIGRLKDADQLLLNLRQQNHEITLITPKMRADMAMEHYMSITDEGANALRTGLRDLDMQLGGGLYAGDLIVVGAATSMGKTAFLQFTANYIGGHLPVLFASAEMSLQGLTDRDVAGISHLPLTSVRLGKYDQATEKGILDGVAKLVDRQVFFVEDKPLTTANIESTALEMSARHGLSAVFVDYLGLLGDRPQKDENQVLRIGRMTRSLKLLAGKLKIPVILAHQINRSVEQRDEKRPRLSDLRDSGEIENHADVVLFLYRDWYYRAMTGEHRGEKDDCITEIIIAKQRQGKANGLVKSYYDELAQVYCGMTKGV